MKIDPLLPIDAILGMLGSSGARKRLVERDAVPDTLPVFPDDPDAKVRVRLDLLRKKFGFTVALMLSAVASGWASGTFLPIVRLSGGQLGGASAFVFACAGLARLGWGGQSWHGKTAVERADASLFYVLCWIGMYLASVAAL